MCLYNEMSDHGSEKKNQDDKKYKMCYFNYIHMNIGQTIGTMQIPQKAGRTVLYINGAVLQLLQLN